MADREKPSDMLPSPQDATELSPAKTAQKDGDNVNGNLYSEESDDLSLKRFKKPVYVTSCDIHDNLNIINSAAEPHALEARCLTLHSIGSDNTVAEARVGHSSKPEEADDPTRDNPAIVAPESLKNDKRRVSESTSSRQDELLKSLLARSMKGEPKSGPVLPGMNHAFGQSSTSTAWEVPQVQQSIQGDVGGQRDGNSSSSSNSGGKDNDGGSKHENYEEIISEAAAILCEKYRKIVYELGFRVLRSHVLLKKPVDERTQASKYWDESLRAVQYVLSQVDYHRDSKKGDGVLTKSYIDLMTYNLHGIVILHEANALLRERMEQLEQAGLGGASDVTSQVGVKANGLTENEVSVAGANWHFVPLAVAGVAVALIIAYVRE